MLDPDQSSAALKLTVVEPPTGWQNIGFSEIWRHRELLVALTMRDVRVRYKQTALGLAWAVLQPFVAMVVFSVVLNGAAGVQSEPGVPYPIFAYSGLVVWFYFADALNRASRSLVTNNLLVSKVYFPRLIAPISGVVAPLLDFAMAFVILIGLMLFYRVGLSWTLLITPLILLAAVLCAAAFGVWLAALNVEYRDIGYAIPLLLQLWLFLTPVVYPASSVHGVLHVVFALNPMASIVVAFRWAMLGHGSVDLALLVPSLLVLAIVLVAGLLYFRRVERTFADAL